jgi:hypothetical protein
MTRVMSFSSPRETVELGALSGIAAKSRLRGTGLPPVSTEWFEGAGDGASFRGGRNLARIMDVDIRVEGINREQVRERLSLIGRIFALPNVVRLEVVLDGEAWFVDVVRTGGGDWDWSSDTDGKTFVKTVLTVQAGDPFWTKSDAEARRVNLAGLGRGLIKATSLSNLRLSASSAFGPVGFVNTGDVAALADWRVSAPFSGFSLISQSGETISWAGTKLTGWIDLSSRFGTVVDELGVNRYSGLAAVPRFWSIPPGESTASVVAVDATSATQIVAIWNAKRWVMF